jgi:hypothetical protein
MTFKHEQVIEMQAEVLNSQRLRALNEYEASRLAGRDDILEHADTIVEIDAKLAALGNIAHQLAAGQQRPVGPAPNKYGLSDEEIAIARASIVDRPDLPKLSDDERQKIYSEQKQKLQRMRASGEYSDRA